MKQQIRLYFQYRYLTFIDSLASKQYLIDKWSSGTDLIQWPVKIRL